MIDEFIFGIKDREKVTLQDVKLVKNYRGYCLDMTYRVETDTEVREINLPCVYLPITFDKVTIDHVWDEYYSDNFVDVGFGKIKTFNSDGDDKGVRYTIKVIKEKTKEMTLAEIEKKLGHKVKIVSKKPTYKKTEDWLEDLKP